MHHRIRSAATVVRHNRILLVRQELPGIEPFWVPPGGGIEAEESIFEAASREACEETRVTVELDRLIYVREYVDRVVHSHEAEFFILTAASHGEPSAERSTPTRAGEYFKPEVRFFTRQQLQTETVYPEILKYEFWDDLEAGFPTVRYLGLSIHGD